MPLCKKRNTRNRELYKNTKVSRKGEKVMCIYKLISTFFHISKEKNWERKRKENPSKVFQLNFPRTEREKKLFWTVEMIFLTCTFTRSVWWESCSEYESDFFKNKEIMWIDGSWSDLWWCVQFKDQDT